MPFKKFGCRHATRVKEPREPTLQQRHKMELHERRKEEEELQRQHRLTSVMYVNSDGELVPYPEHTDADGSDAPDNAQTTTKCPSLTGSCATAQCGGGNTTTAVVGSACGADSFRGPSDSASDMPGGRPSTTGGCTPSPASPSTTTTTTNARGPAAATWDSLQSQSLQQASLQRSGHCDHCHEAHQPGTYSARTTPRAGNRPYTRSRSLEPRRPPPIFVPREAVEVYY